VGFDPRLAEKGASHGADVRIQDPAEGVKPGRFPAGPLLLSPFEEPAKPASPEADEIGLGNEPGQALLDLAAIHETARERAALAGGANAGLEDVGRGAGQPAHAIEGCFEGTGRAGSGPPNEKIVPELRVVMGRFFDDRDGQAYPVME
jgi:hypothetical protein